MFTWAGGFPATNFQLLMLSPYLLKTKFPYVQCGWGSSDQLPTFEAESKSAKNQISLLSGAGSSDQLSTFDAESIC